MSASRGVFRLWVVGAAVWIIVAGYMLWPLKIPNERQWPPDVSFCRSDIGSPPAVPAATCERRYRELVLEEWERLGLAVSVIVLPPFVVWLVGLWVARGFRTAR